MSVFEPITLEWDGKEYTIASDRVMGAINRAEQHYTLAEIYADRTNRQTVRMQALAAAYGSVLRYAGAQATDDDVYLSLFGGADSSEAGAAIMNALDTLAALMTPPSLTTSKKSQPKRTSGSKAGKGLSSKPSSSPAETASLADGD